MFRSNRSAVKPAPKSASALAIIGALLATFWLAAHSSSAPASANKSDKVTCQTLRETLTRPRWLSLPMSRLVVSPNYTINGVDAPLHAPSIITAHVTDLAYYVGEKPEQLPEFLSWTPVSAAVGSPDNIQVGQKLDFARSAWTVDQASAQFTDTALRITPIADYGSVNWRVAVDLDKSPNLLIQVAGTTGHWAIKVNDGGKDIPLVMDATEIGARLINITRAAGWHGDKAFTVKLFAVGGPKSSVTVSRLQFVASPPLAARQSETVTWFPHKIVSSIAESNRPLKVLTTTAFLDESTLAERLHIVKAGSGALRIMGKFVDGAIAPDEARHRLILSNDHFHATLAVSRPVRWLGIRPSLVDWATSAAPVDSQSGVWAVEVDNIKPGDDIIVTAHFAPSPAKAGGAHEDAVDSTPKHFAVALAHQEALWNKRLTSVPRPLDFTPRAVSADGVTAAQIRRTYYRAWVFLLADSLPPMPENHNSYPQLAAGKPSLWNEGAPGSRPSAQWESFLAMQAIAPINPHMAWAAYEGEMSLLGPDGSLNGEGLPSCHVQTAWQLYQAIGDVAPLRRLYPKIKQFLLWKIANPRWILNGATPTDSKDNEFVVHALTDIDYAAQVAAVLQRPKEVQFWLLQRAALSANFHKWFWQPPNGPMYRIDLVSKNQRSGADSSWNLAALILPRDILTDAERQNLLQLCKRLTHGDLPFLISGLTKFPDYEDAWKGLVQDGKMGEASTMADAGMRDVSRAREFSEVYDQKTPPQPAGVRPSVFGSRHAIDDVLWHNGIIFDEGLPILVGMPGAVGVSNLPVRGAPISVKYGAQSNVSLEGPGLRHLQLPKGFKLLRTSEGRVCWQGKLAQGAIDRLEWTH